jgi:pyruvate dehydrogenase E1 component alpha subunit
MTSHSADATTTPTAADAREILRTMCLIRAFEDRAVQLYNEGLIVGAIHSSAGQEAAAVGLCRALRADDYLAATHRGHGHAIAKGARAPRLMAELMGRVAGYCSGKGGSMHVADFEIGMLGANGIVGASVGLAAGAALSARVRKTDQVAVGILGDGGIAEGAVHESMNLASLWKLPLIFFCENNQYAVSLPVTRGIAAAPLGAIAEAHRIPSHSVDGMSFGEVLGAAQEAVERARAGEGPSFIEALTYRFQGHSRGDPKFGPYRTQEEWDEWSARDPIVRFATEESLDDELDQITADVERELDEAVSFARDSEEPNSEDAFAHVYPSGLQIDRAAPGNRRPHER